MKMIWVGRGVSGLLMVPFVMGVFMALSGNPQAAAGMEKMGLPASLLRPLGIVELLCMILYLTPQTAVLGAVLFTGYMGGAIMAHLRIGEPIYFPLIFGMLIWLGPYLREARLRDLLPLRK